MSSRPAWVIFPDPELKQSNEKITSYQLRPEPKLLEPGVGSASGESGDSVSHCTLEVSRVSCVKVQCQASFSRSSQALT